jgi:hypothetical protein
MNNNARAQTETVLNFRLYSTFTAVEIVLCIVIYVFIIELSELR